MNNKIKTAGGIVLKDDKILFIYKRGRWDLPKGKVEEGASSRKTAKIEISEETGLPCLLYTSPSPRDLSTSRMPSSA